MLRILMLRILHARQNQTASVMKPALSPDNLNRSFTNLSLSLLRGYAPPITARGDSAPP